MSYVLEKAKLTEFLSAIKDKYHLLAPVKEDDVFLFREIEDPKAVDLSYLNTKKSIKEFFFPQSECVLNYRYEGRDVKVEQVPVKQEKRVIFGARPCDIYSLEIMDKIFNWDFKDEYYNSKRENTLLISLLCTATDPTCFCYTFGIGPDYIGVSDVTMIDLKSNKFFLRGCTEKGRDFLKEFSHLLILPAEGEEEKARLVSREAKEEFIPSLDMTVVRSTLADNKFFNNPIWDAVAEKCIKCGVCTYVCPTCHCFDFTEQGDYRGGERIKCWDSCMFTDFTAMAGGHNPRKEDKRRYRQRILHKFSYFLKNLGVIACVGCGRCIRECPANLNLIEILNTVGGGTGE